MNSVKKINKALAQFDKVTKQLEEAQNQAVNELNKLGGKKVSIMQSCEKSMVRAANASLSLVSKLEKAIEYIKTRCKKKIEVLKAARVRKLKALQAERDLLQETSLRAERVADRMKALTK